MGLHRNMSELEDRGVDDPRIYELPALNFTLYAQRRDHRKRGPRDDERFADRP